MAGGLQMFTQGLGMIGSAFSWDKARREKRKAQKFIDNFEPEPLSNKFKDLQVSTLGADYQTAESAMDFKNITEAARGGGMRGIMGATQTAQNNRDKVMQQVAANLDAQQKSLDVLAARDEVRIEGIREKRSQDELAGYGKLLDIARNDEKQAFANIFSSLMGYSSPEKPDEDDEEGQGGVTIGGMGNFGTSFGDMGGGASMEGMSGGTTT